MQQAGQPLGCEQLILFSNNLKVCDDPMFGKELCCASCAVLWQQTRANWDAELAEMAPQLAKASAVLARANRELRSPPLHGRGQGMPRLVLGTGNLRGWKAANIVEIALRMGYRHLDTALGYENHVHVRQGVEQSGVPREDVFVTTKLPPEMMGFKAASAAVAKIQAELPGNYADLCLIHWPHAKPADDGPQGAGWMVVERAGTWRALEEAFDSGICRAIGVGNYMRKHMEELESYARIKPSATQMEYSPLAPLGDVVDYCQGHGMVLMAFGWMRPAILEQAAVQEAARELGRGRAEAVALWLLQIGHAPIYASSRLDRLLEHAMVASEERAPFSYEQGIALGEAILSQKEYPWGYYTGKHGNPYPWTVPVMGEAASFTT